jgi:transposase-like protein
MSSLSSAEFHDEGAAIVEVESILWPNGPVCPRCGGADRITRVNGKTARPGLRRCGPCERQFTVTVGTIFESSRLPLNKWLQVIYLMASSGKGTSSHPVMRTLNCQYRTAWGCHAQGSRSDQNQDFSATWRRWKVRRVR